GLFLVVRRFGALVGHLEEQQIGQLLDVVAVRHAVVAEGEPGFLASTYVLACRRTGAALSAPWAVTVVPEFLDDGRSVHRALLFTPSFSGLTCYSPLGGQRTRIHFAPAVRCQFCDLAACFLHGLSLHLQLPPSLRCRARLPCLRPPS